MGIGTKISWADHTVNLWTGCTKVHDGCENCYAETQQKRFGRDNWGDGKPRIYVKSAIKTLNKIHRLATKEGKMQTVFIGSLMDIFEKNKDVVDHNGEMVIGSTDTETIRRRLFRDIEHGKYNNIRFLLLTKRPSNINKMIPEKWVSDQAPSNVWFGTSPVDQKTFDTLVPQLAKVKGKRFLSIEPQLDFIDTTKGNFLAWDEIHWIINGGESGANRRPFDVFWAYTMKEQCKANKVPYFFKQIDKIITPPASLELEKNLPWK